MTEEITPIIITVNNTTSKIIRDFKLLLCDDPTDVDGTLDLTKTNFDGVEVSLSNMPWVGDSYNRFLWQIIQTPFAVNKTILKTADVKMNPSVIAIRTIRAFRNDANIHMKRVELVGSGNINLFESNAYYVCSLRTYLQIEKINPNTSFTLYLYPAVKLYI